MSCPVSNREKKTIYFSMKLLFKKIVDEHMNLIVYILDILFYY
jgi:hypothetical protein